MMIPLTIESEPVPLRVDSTGTTRVGDSRVTLDLVVLAFLDGLSAEEIVEEFPTLTLGDVYSVLGFYLHHRDSVDAYLRERQRQADDLRLTLESRYERSVIRQRLLGRQSDRQTP